MELKSLFSCSPSLEEPFIYKENIRAKKFNNAKIKFLLLLKCLNKHYARKHWLPAVFVGCYLIPNS